MTLLMMAAVTDEQESVNADAVRFPQAHALCKVVAHAVDARYNGGNSLVKIRRRVTAVIRIEFRMTVRINDSRCHPQS